MFLKGVKKQHKSDGGGTKGLFFVLSQLALHFFFFFNQASA